jgi:TolB-like protein
VHKVVYYMPSSLKAICILFMLNGFAQSPTDSVPVQSQAVLVALAPVTAPTFTSQEQAVWMERLATTLVQSPNYRLITQQANASMAQEAALEQTGCVLSSCYMQASASQGAQKIIFSKINTVNKLYSLELRLADIQTGRTEKVLVVDSKKSKTQIVQNESTALMRLFIGNSGRAVVLDTSFVQKPVAVLDLTVNGLDTLTGKGLSDRLRTELYKTSRFEVLEREEMAEILKEQAFTASMCAGDDCSVQMGKIIGVRYMVAGSVTQIGSYYSVAVRLIDVESAAVVRSVSVDVQANLETVLTNTMEDAARVLSGLPLRDRVNKKGLTWAAVSATLGAVGGYVHYLAWQNNQEYLAEQESVSALLQYKQDARMQYGTAAALYSTALLSLGVSLYHYLVPTKSVKTSGAPQATNTSLAPHQGASHKVATNGESSWAPILHHITPRFVVPTTTLSTGVAGIGVQSIWQF